MDAQEILKIHTSLWEVVNFAAWQSERSVCFSVKSAYHIVMFGHVLIHVGGATSANSQGT